MERARRTSVLLVSTLSCDSGASCFLWETAKRTARSLAANVVRCKTNDTAQGSVWLHLPSPVHTRRERTVTGKGDLEVSAERRTGPQHVRRPKLGPLELQNPLTMPQRTREYFGEADRCTCTLGEGTGCPPLWSTWLMAGLVSEKQLVLGTRKSYYTYQQHY